TGPARPPASARARTREPMSPHLASRERPKSAPSWWHRARRGAMWIGNAAVLSVLAPLLAHALLPPVRFNQFMLQRLEVRYGLVDFEMMVDGLRSAHGSGLRSLWPKRERRP